jgi:DNA-directed RNA polymerase specialized sigma24 family protein
MSTDEMVNVLYGYSRAACKNTSLDYRDVAHGVISRILPNMRLGKIRHIRTYMYITVTCVIATMMRAESKYAKQFDYRVEGVYCNYDNRMGVEEICEAASDRECFMIRQTINGYTRQEIADMLGMTRNGVNIIWYRLAHRLRGAL